jgi:hypothetical protein
MKQGLPIWRDSNRLVVEVELAVRNFARYHKYTLGTDLRRQAMGIMRLLTRALHDDTQRLRYVKRLVLAIDDLKVMLQMGKELRAFDNFRRFQQLAELAVGVGRQAGAWLKKLSERAHG